MIDIKSKSGVVKLSIPITGGALHKKELMKEDYILLPFSYDSVLSFEKGDYIEYEGKNYEIVDITFPSESDKGYNYELRFDSPEKKWAKKICFYNRQNQKEKSWALTSTLTNFLTIVCDNLKALGYKYNGLDYTYSIGGDVPTTILYLSFDARSIFDVLTYLAEKWETEWLVSDNVIHFGRCELGTEVNLEEGVNVSGMTRSDGNSYNYVTRLYAFGSTRNIPTNYRPTTEGLVVEGVVEKRLLLPSPIDHIDAWENMREEDVVEGVMAFEVYPKRVGTVSNITTKEYTNTETKDDGTEVKTYWNAYIFKDAGFNFLKSYILPGVELKVIFQTGPLAGMEFSIADFNETAQTFEIKRNDTYGINLPNDVLFPSVGDTYILSGYDPTFVSTQLIPEAEQELLSVARDYLAKNSVDTSVYTCPVNKIRVSGYVNGVYSEANVQDFEVGQKVKLINPVFLKSGRSSRVYGFEKKLDDKFDCAYTVGESTQYSRIGEIEEKVKTITYKGQVFTGGSGNSIYLITKYDTTKPSDITSFSALRALEEFVGKELFNNLFEIKTDVSGNNTLRVKGNLYADGGISALGENTVSGGGSTGLDYDALREMLIGSVNAYEINAVFLTAITKEYITGKLGATYSLSSHGHSLSSLTNDVGFITAAALFGLASESYVNTKINDLINGAPAAYDTLKEIADVLAANVNSINDILTAIGTKWTQDNTKISNWDSAATIANALATWAKSPTKPSYSYGEITGRPTTFEEAGIEGGSLTDVLYGVDAEFSSIIKSKSFGTGSSWAQGEDSNGDLVWYKNGVAVAKLTALGFVSLGGVTCLE